MSLKVKPVFFKTDRERARSILQPMREILPARVELAEEALIDSWEDFNNLRQGMEDVGALLELSEDFRRVPVRLLLWLGDLGPPVIMFGGEFVPGARRLEASGYLKAHGKTAILPLTLEDLKTRLSTLETKQRIQRLHAVLIGSRYGSGSVVTSSPDFAVAQQALGVVLHHCDIPQFLQAYDETDQALVADLAGEWLRGAQGVVEPTEEDVERSARSYWAIKRTLDEHGAGAIAMDCLGIAEMIKGTPCLALVKLNDEGVPAACEGDLTALMTMIFLSHLADRPTFMGNIVYANPRENLIDVNHCVLPFCMEGYAEQRKPYTLRGYHDRSYGATATFDPGTGQEVTVARFDTLLQELVFVKGTVIACEEGYCRFNLRVKVANAGELIRQVRGNHHILVYGDHTERIKDLCRELGIVPVAV